MVSKNLKGAYSEVCALAAPDLQFRAAYEQVVNLISLHRPQETVGRRTLMLEYYDARQGIIIGARSLKAGWGFVKVARPNGPYKGIFGNTPGLPVKRSDKPKDNLPKQDQ